jgi:hypothetical protein
MPIPRKYESQAEKQKAYRARRANQEPAARAAVTPGYAKWRKTIREAFALLTTTYDELDAWMKERSERWQESDRAADLEADRDKLWEILDGLEELSIRGKAQ